MHIWAPVYINICLYAHLSVYCISMAFQLEKLDSWQNMWKDSLFTFQRLLWFDLALSVFRQICLQCSEDTCPCQNHILKHNWQLLSFQILPMKEPLIKNQTNLNWKCKRNLLILPETWRLLINCKVKRLIVLNRETRNSDFSWRALLTKWGFGLKSCF